MMFNLIAASLKEYLKSPTKEMTWEKALDINYDVIIQLKYMMVIPIVSKDYLG